MDPETWKLDLKTWLINHRILYSFDVISLKKDVRCWDERVWRRCWKMRTMIGSIITIKTSLKIKGCGNIASEKLHYDCILLFWTSFILVYILYIYYYSIYEYLEFLFSVLLSVLYILLGVFVILLLCFEYFYSGIYTFQYLNSYFSFSENIYFRNVFFSVTWITKTICNW